MMEESTSKHVASPTRRSRLRIRLTEPATCNIVEPPKRKPRKTSTQKMRTYKEKLKKDPEAFAQFKKCDAMRSKLYRLNMDEEQRKQANDKGKLRMRQATISGAKDLYEWASSDLTRNEDHPQSHFKRTIFWVGEGEITRERADRSVSTLKGTRQLHSISCVESGKVKTRNLSCHCKACIDGVGPCTNIAVVKNWEMQTLKGIFPSNGRNRRPAAVPSPPRQDLDALPPPIDTLAIGELHVPDTSSQPETQNLQQGDIVSVILETTGRNTRAVPDTSSQPETQNLQQGDFVSVILETTGRNRRAVTYYAMVLSIESGEAQVKYIRKGNGMWYFFPNIDDIGWESCTKMTKLISPTMDNRGHYTF